MIVNPHLINVNGGGTSNDYIYTNLSYFRVIPNNAQSGAISTLNSGYSFDFLPSGCCLEICLKPVTLPSSSEPTYDLIGFEVSEDYPIDFGCVISSVSEHLGNNSNYAILFYAGQYAYICNAPNLIANQKHTFSFSINNGTLSAYVDGSLFGTESASNFDNPVSCSALEILGYNSDWKDLSKIYAVRAYYSSLTTAQVLQNYQKDASLFGNL